MKTTVFVIAAALVLCAFVAPSSQTANRANSFLLIDTEGNVRGGLELTGARIPRLFLNDAKGATRAELSVGSSGTAFTLRDETGRKRLHIEEAGDATSMCFFRPDGAPSITLADGKKGAELMFSAGSPQLSVGFRQAFKLVINEEKTESSYVPATAVPNICFYSGHLLNGYIMIMMRTCPDGKEVLQLCDRGGKIEVKFPEPAGESFGR